MQLKYTMALFAGILFFAEAVLGNDPIDGGFGLQLGHSLDPALIVSEETDNFHFNYFLVSPPRIARQFQHYGVYITPFSKKIYKIVATGRNQTMEQCRHDAMGMFKELQALHGPPVENNLNQAGLARFASEARVIVIECELSSLFIYLRVTYSDSELAQESG